MSAEMEEDELALSEGEEGPTEEGYPEDEGARQHEEQVRSLYIVIYLIFWLLSAKCLWLPRNALTLYKAFCSPTFTISLVKTSSMSVLIYFLIIQLMLQIIWCAQT